jgi:DNA-binding transcriptional regulator of glucitol operon
VRVNVDSLSRVITRWFSGRAFALHATVLVVVTACLALGWWQLERALSGNTLSWVYTFEWPFFAIYAVYMWWRLLHEEPGARGRSRPRRQPSVDKSREEDEKLAEYNRYLAELRASDES